VSTIAFWRVRLADHFESNRDAKTLIPRTSSHRRLLRNRRRLSPRRVWMPFECSLSQVARQSLPHRPTHLNWFDQSSMTPPHSGQMQFTMADLTLAIDRIELSIYSSFNEEKYPVLEKLSRRATSTPCSISADCSWRPYLDRITLSWSFS